MKEIKLTGVIDGNAAARFEAELAAVSEREPLLIRIHSEGGNVFDGFAIYEKIRQHAGQTTVRIESAAFSIASLIAQAGDRVEIAPNGFIMIHSPMATVQGGADDFKRKGELLERLTLEMVGVYSARTRLSSAQIRTMLRTETWLDANEAVEMGFADVVTNSEVFAVVASTAGLDIPEHITASVGGKLQNQCNMEGQNMSTALTPDEILEVYPQATDAFIIECVSQKLTRAAVASAAITDLASQNAVLRDKAKAGQLVGQMPVAMTTHPGGTGFASARAEWQSAIEAHVANGLPRAQAVRQVNASRPGLREAVVNEANS